MSDQTPEPTLDPTPDPTEAPPRRRRGLILGLVAGFVVLALGGAAFGAWKYLDGGGPRPEDTLPASTVAVMSIDLDPKAGQKIEAIKTLRKFPALRESLGIDSQDDLRRFVVDKGLAGVCDDIDYDADVEPWIGKRAAFAAVDLGDDLPAPALLLQISDSAKAASGFEQLMACGRDQGMPEDFGYVVEGDYLIASDSRAHAQAIAAAGQEKPLADDAAYQKWTGEAGGGVLNVYVGPKVTQYVGELIDAFLSGIGPEFADGFTAGLESQGLGDDPADVLGEELADFGGAAASLRFADGGMEFVVAGESGQTEDLEGDALGSTVANLPTDTALAIGLAVPEDFAGTVLDRVQDSGLPEVASFLEEVERQTGLRLPEDLDTLLGRAITLSIGGDAPSFEDLNDPEKVPVGLSLHTDPDEALAVIGTAEDALGFGLADIPVATEKTDDTLVLSPSSAYAEELSEAGGLGGSAIFRKAVPDSGRAQFVFFLAVDEAWRSAIIDFAAEGLSPDEADQVRENLEPFAAFGLSSSVEDGVARFQVRVATN